jgi:hypothetical protein
VPKGEVDEAIACFQQSIDLDANYSNARSNLAAAKRLALARDNEKELADTTCSGAC